MSLAFLPWFVRSPAPRAQHPRQPGWTAVTGHLEPPALLQLLTIFVWTPPHFWALAIARRAGYAKIDIPMLPVTPAWRSLNERCCARSL
jgi:heme O synthase-like polyprenyltransferase